MLENKTLYNAKTIHEAMKPLNRPMMIYIYIVTAVLLGLSAWQFFGVGGNYGFLFGAVALIIAVFNYLQLTKRLKARETSYLKSMREKKGVDEYTNHLFIDNEKIRNADPTNAVELYHTDIKAVDQGKNLIMIRYKTGKLVIVDKSGFVKGSAEEFLNILRSFGNNNKR